jgi:hypothetical protein
MAKVNVQVEVSKELFEVGKGLADFAKHLKAAVADGWQIGSDLPAVLTAVMADLVPALQGVDKIPAEFAEDKMAFANACTVAGGQIVAAVLG